MAGRESIGRQWAVRHESKYLGGSFIRILHSTYSQLVLTRYFLGTYQDQPTTPHDTMIDLLVLSLTGIGPTSSPPCKEEFPLAHCCSRRSDFPIP